MKNENDASHSQKRSILITSLMQAVIHRVITKNASRIMKR